MNDIDAKQVILLDRTNISRKIGVSLCQDMSQFKIFFVENSIYVPIFLDESTTVSMKSKPVYCGIMVIQKCFIWIIMFVGQKGTSCCGCSDDLFQNITFMYVPYNIFPNILAIGTDGCASM